MSTGSSIPKSPRIATADFRAGFQRLLDATFELLDRPDRAKCRPRKFACYCSAAHCNPAPAGMPARRANAARSRRLEPPAAANAIHSASNSNGALVRSIAVCLLRCWIEVLFEIGIAVGPRERTRRFRPRASSVSVGSGRLCRAECRRATWRCRDCRSRAADRFAGHRNMESESAGRRG